jgi:hypothetical protein
MSAIFAKTVSESSAARPSIRALSAFVSRASASSSKALPAASSASNRTKFFARRSGLAEISGVGMLGNVSRNSNTSAWSLGFRSKTLGARTTSGPTFFSPFSLPLPSNSSLIEERALRSNSGR